MTRRLSQESGTTPKARSETVVTGGRVSVTRWIKADLATSARLLSPSGWSMLPDVSTIKATETSPARGADPAPVTGAGATTLSVPGSVGVGVAIGVGWAVGDGVGVGEGSGVLVGTGVGVAGGALPSTEMAYMAGRRRLAAACSKATSMSP